MKIKTILSAYRIGFFAGRMSVYYAMGKKIVLKMKDK